MHLAPMNGPPLGPDLTTFTPPVLGPGTLSAGAPVLAAATSTGQSSPRSDTHTELSPDDATGAQTGLSPRNVTDRLSPRDVTDDAAGAQTQVSPRDVTDHASDEIPRLTRQYQSSEDDRMSALTSLLGLLRTDERAGEAEHAPEYGPITRHTPQQDCAVDIQTLQLQCAGLLARVEDLEGRKTQQPPTPHSRGNHRGRDYHRQIKQRSQHRRDKRNDKRMRDI